MVYNNNKFINMNVKDIVKQTMNKLHKHLTEFHIDIINSDHNNIDILDFDKKCLDFNLQNMNSKYIDFVIDDTKLKQGKYLPGLKIQVKDWSALDIKNHHQFIVLSWNYAESFITRLRSLGVTGKVLIPFPNFQEVIL
jgi:hypothetical protein